MIPVPSYLIILSHLLTSSCNPTNTIYTSSDNQTCEGGDFSCFSSAECVPYNWTCDREADCEDGSDESPSVCSERGCGDDEVRCGDGGGGDGVQCVPLSWVCDNKQDCLDGSDESVCTTTCLSEEFTCASGLCIQPAWRCDGEDDCGDGSDEEGCAAKVCTRGEVQCREGRCVKNSHVCDGDSGKALYIS